MKRLLSRCQASIERGLGGQTKARTMELRAIAAKRAEGYDQGYRGAVLAIWWVLREIELANIRMHNTHVQFSDGSGTLGLPVSKTDAQGASAKRTLACWCGTSLKEEGMVIDKWSCPSCNLKQQYEAAMKRHKVDPGSLEALDGPLFGSEGAMVGRRPSSSLHSVGWIP